MSVLVSNAENLNDDVAFALVIDDDLGMAEEIAESLALPGSAIRISDNLAGALTAVEQNPTIELIVTDFHLSKNNASIATGEQLIDCLSCLYPSREFEFVVISGDPYSFIRLRDRKTVTCQAKPPAPNELLDLMVSKSIPTRYAQLIMKSRMTARSSKGSRAFEPAPT